MDQLDLLAVQVTLKSLLQHHSLLSRGPGLGVGASLPPGGLGAAGGWVPPELRSSAIGGPGRGGAGEDS